MLFETVDALLFTSEIIIIISIIIIINSISITIEFLFFQMRKSEVTREWKPL